MADSSNVGEVVLKDVRGSYLHIFKPQKPRKGDDGQMQPGKYGGTFLIPKPEHDDYDKKLHKDALDKMLAAIAAVKAEKWGTKNPPKFKSDKIPLRNGDAEGEDEQHANCWFVSTNNGNQPSAVDRSKDAKGNWIALTVENGGPKKIYSGGWYNVVIRVWAQDNDFGKRINASLESIQFNRHGEAFSGVAPVNPNEKFDDVEELDADDLDESKSGDEDDDDIASLLG